MKRVKLTLAVIFVLVFVLYPSSASAHVGGVPFLKINGQFAPANVAYFSNVNLQGELPQDMGLEKYLVNTKIEFEIDRDQIPVQKELLEKATFRWSFDEGSTDYSFGLKVTHTYTAIGSHLIYLWVKAPDEVEFTLYDIIQVEVVDNPNYQLPTAVVQIPTKNLRPDAPIDFKAQFNTNPGNKIESYYWFVGDQKTANVPQISRTFTGQDFFDLVFLSYKDDVGFVGYRAIWLEEEGGKINLPFPPNSREEVILAQNESTPFSETQKWTKSSFYYLLLLPASLALILVFIFVRRKNKR